jgi:hypothetical protein
MHSSGKYTEYVYEFELAAHVKRVYIQARNTRKACANNAEVNTVIVFDKLTKGRNKK